MRVAIGGIHIESSTFSPIAATADDFEQSRGAVLLARYSWRDDAWARGVAWLPTLHARALPGGVVTADTYAAFRTELLQSLAELGDVDGFLLDCHGAMSVAGLDDAEADLAAAIRSVVGPDCLISASFDLHGNVSADLFGCVDLLTAYRTAPHVDVWETRERAARNLVDCLRRGERPFRALVRVPILLPGEQTSTQIFPGDELYRLVGAVAGRDGVLDAACLMGFPWADQPRCCGAVVVTGFDEAAVRQGALELADRFWAARDEFTFVGPTGSFDEALAAALDGNARPFFISDTGDNPGAGGTDDATFVLHALAAFDVAPDAADPPAGQDEASVGVERAERPAVERAQRVETTPATPTRPPRSFADLGRHVLVASVHDPAAARLAHRLGAGAYGQFALGGHDDRTAPAYVSVARVAAVTDDPAGGAVALLAFSHGVSLIVTERRKQYRLAADYARLGVPLDEQDIVVVKIGYLEPELAAVARGWRMALTPGAVTQDLGTLPYRRLTRPLVPLDRDVTWTAAPLVLR